MTARRDTNKRKQDILLAAAKLFRDRSYLATTLDDIAGKVGINKATIYFYFKSKEQLLYEILTAALQEYVESAQTIISSDAPPIAKIESLVRAHLDIGTRPDSLNAVSLFERKNLSPRLLKAYNSQRDGYEQIFRDVLKDGMAGKEFAAGDRAMMSRFILSIANSTIMWFKRTGPLSIEQVGDKAWAFILYGLKTKRMGR